jgi:hypothetical protein
VNMKAVVCSGLIWFRNGEMRNVYKILIGEHDEETQLQRLYSLEPSIHKTTVVTVYISISLSSFIVLHVLSYHHQEHCDMTLKLYFATQT